MLFTQTTGCVGRLFRGSLAGAVLLTFAAVAPRPARADFINGGFESTPGGAFQPFPGWLTEYRTNCPHTAWSTTANPLTFPLPQWVAAANFNSVSIPAICGSRMAQINDIFGNCHETRISQSVVLTAAEIDSCGTATVQVCWIGVFEHPTNGVPHSTSEQPYFSFLLNHTVASTGITTAVDSAAFPSIDATTPGSGWIDAGNSASGAGRIYYRKTCTPLIVLDATAGDTVRVVMEVRDCTKSGHGAMAFLDCAHIAPGPPSGTGTTLTPQYWSLAVTSSLGHEAGDFDSDGKCDLVDYVAGSPAYFLRVLESNGSTFLPPTFPTAVATTWTRLHTGDFDGDGCTDVAGWTGTNLHFVWADCATAAMDFVNTQNDIPIAGGVGTGGRFWIGDFNGDGRDDVARDTGAFSTGLGIEVALATGVRAAPLLPFSLWLNSGAIPGTFYVCDYNGDGKSDLMKSLPFGMYFLVSTGSSFAQYDKWRTEGPPTGGWSVGDFECDGHCEVIQRTSTGVLEMLDIAPPPNNGKGNLTAITSPGIAAGPFAVGDFDGNGSDDLSHVLPGLGVEVIRSCAGCPCMRVDIEPVCDYPDRSKQDLRITINNHSGGPIQSVNIVPTGAFTVSPTSVTLTPPLQNRRTRTIVVTATGIPPLTLRCVRVDAVRNAAVVCNVTACFTTPDCNCLDLFAAAVYCKPDGSGSTCIDFNIQNASGAAAKFIRLSPAASFFPNLITMAGAGLANGQTYSASNCSIRLIPNGNNYLCFTVELLDAGMNVICLEEACADVNPCPTVLGECCVTGVGLSTQTATDCAILGGTWTPPGVSQYCPYGGGGSGAQKRLIVPRSDTYVTNTEENRTFIAHRTGGSDPAADFLTPAANEICWPMDALDPRNPVGSGVLVHLGGNAGGQPLGSLEIGIGGTGEDGIADFSSAGATTITVLGEGLDSYVPFDVPSSLAVFNMARTPDRVRAVLSDFPMTTHGFVLEFDELTTVVVEGGPVMEVCELRLLAGGSPQVSYLTSVGFRGLNQPIVALGLVRSTLPPCLADLTGDCIVNNADVAFFNSGAPAGEVDVNGDGMAGLDDLSMLLASFGTVCPCGLPPPSPCPGDANADGMVNFSDVTGALANFGAVYPAGTGLGDANLSGDVTFADITSALSNWAAVCP